MALVSILCLNGGLTLGKKQLVKKLKKGLTIKESDWSEPETKHGYVNFLDISFSFDNSGYLQTDLFTKPTDARSYLNFSSCHPNFTFAGNVYSQALRLRRIINNKERLILRLNEMKEDFKKCGYPDTLLENIFNKVECSERDLLKKVRKKDVDDKLLVISTYGRDNKLTKAVSGIEKWSNDFQFKFVKKTAPSLKNMLDKSKNVALGICKGATTRCSRRNCKLCKMVSNKNYVIGPKKKKFKTAEGNCATKNVIYHDKCKLCEKVYVGKTITALSTRVNTHRSKFYELVKTGSVVKSDNEDHLLGLHLYQQHGLQFSEGFSEPYKFTILELCSPKNIDFKEHVWIQRLKSICPLGLNSHDPFGIPLIL